MSRAWSAIRSISTMLMVLFAFVVSLYDQWDKATFFMVFACFALLTERDDD